jgi:UDP-N-acetyl-2-amino-2-deoxyglucuronate dehydrogenase
LKTYRSLEIDGKKIEFDNGFQDLHTKSYQEILAGRGFGVREVKSSINIVCQLR